MKLAKTAFADYLPTWNPATNELYLFRTPSKQTTPDGYETNFYLLPVEKGEPTLLQKLSVLLPPLSVCRPVSISPDGKQIAFLVLPNNYFENPQTGVWVMNLEDKSFKQIVGLNDLQSRQIQQAEERKDFLLIPNTIGWAGNDALVVSSKEMQMPGILPQTSYYIDLTKDQAIPLLDFSDIKSQADYFKGYVLTQNPK